MVAAADRPERIGAVVSRGGRPDLAGAALPQVTVPTLLIVGGEDYPVIEMNEEAMRALRCEKRMEIVPGATHLFESPVLWSESRNWPATGFSGTLCLEAASMGEKAAIRLIISQVRG